MFSSKDALYPEDNSETIVAIVVSILLHIGFVILILRQPEGRPPEQPLEVSMVTLEDPKVLKNEPQIVSPSERTEIDKPNPEAKLLSDRDSTVTHEQKRVGDPGGMVGPPSEPSVPKEEQKPQKEEKQQQPQKGVQKPRAEKEDSKQQPKPPKNQEAPKNDDFIQELDNKPRKIKQLTLDTETTISRFGVSNGSNTESDRSFSPQNYKAFSRPPGSGAAFLGSGGIRDYLPNLPDGDITLLNEKASTYASFVRRVASQVFSQLRQSGWESISRADIMSISDFTTVTAVLSPHGQLLRVELHDTSGSRRFDEALVVATKAGARDPNPPAGALAADGNIRFIFKARSWSEVWPDPRGFPSERRWLLLATGLE